MSLLLAFILKHWRGIVLTAFLAAVLVAVWIGGVRHGVAKGERAVRASEVAAANARADVAEQTATATKAQAERYRVQAESNAATAKQYLEAYNDANRKRDRDVADLRAGNLRLRGLWTRCQAVSPTPGTGQAGSGGSEPDADADLRFQGAADLVRNADQCDAQVTALQAILTKERQ